MDVESESEDDNINNEHSTVDKNSFKTEMECEENLNLSIEDIEIESRSSPKIRLQVRKPGPR